MTPLDFLSVLSIWLYIGWYGARILPRSLSGQPIATTYIWGLLLAAGGIFTFRILPVQHFFDDLARGAPLGMWLRGASITAAGWSYLLLLRHVGRTSDEIFPAFTRYLYPFLLLLPPSSLLITASLLTLPDHARAYYAILILVDVMTFFLIGAAFIPVNVRMLHHETVRAMRLKHSATICLCLCYAAPFSLTLRRNLDVLERGEMTPPANLGVFAALAVVCIIIQFAPYKMLATFFLPLDYWSYARLYRLERRIAFVRQTTSRAAAWVKPPDLAQAHYATLISILDSAPLLPDTPEGQRLQREIDTLTRKTA